MEEWLVKCVIRQGTLLPFSPLLVPRSDSLEPFLRLFPLPDVVRLLRMIENSWCWVKEWNRLYLNTVVVRCWMWVVWWRVDMCCIIVRVVKLNWMSCEVFVGNSLVHWLGLIDIIITHNKQQDSFSQYRPSSSLTILLIDRRSVSIASRRRLVRMIWFVYIRVVNNVSITVVRVTRETHIHLIRILWFDSFIPEFRFSNSGMYFWIQDLEISMRFEYQHTSITLSTSSSQQKYNETNNHYTSEYSLDTPQSWNDQSLPTSRRLDSSYDNTDTHAFPRNH